MVIRIILSPLIFLYGVMLTIAGFFIPVIPLIMLWSLVGIVTYPLLKKEDRFEPYSNSYNNQITNHIISFLFPFWFSLWITKKYLLTNKVFPV